MQHEPSLPAPGSDERTVAFDVVHLPDGRVVFARTVTPDDPEGTPIVSMAVPVDDDREPEPLPDSDEVFAIRQSAMKARIEQAFPIIEVDEEAIEVEDYDDKTDPETLHAPSVLPPVPPLPPLPPRAVPSTSSSLWSVSVAAPVSTPRPFAAPRHDAHTITIPPSQIRTSDAPPAFVRLDATPSSISLPPFAPRRRVVLNHALIGVAAMFAAVISSVGTMEFIRFYRGETTSIGAAMHRSTTQAPLE